MHKNTTDLPVPKTTRELVHVMVAPYRGQTVLFFVLTFLGIVAWTASPFIVSEIITDLSKTSKVSSYIWWLTFWYFVARVLDEMFWRIGELVMRSYKPQMIERVRTLLFAATLKKPHDYYVNASSGRIAHWVNRATETCNELVDTTIWTVWGRVIGLIASTVFLFLVHWSLAILFAVWLVLLFWYNIHRGKRFSQLIEVQSDETSKASGIVVDSLSNHLSVRIFNARNHEKQLLMGQQNKIIEAWRKSWLQNIVTNMAKGQSAAFVSAGALVLVLILYAHGTVQIGGIVLFIAYFGDASSTLWQLAWALDNYYRNFGTIQNALDGLNADDEPKGQLVNLTDLPELVNIELGDVSFAYPDQSNHKVLDGVSLAVPAGQKLGIVGHSGAGKSTLVGLLLSFYPPTEGTVRVNDVNITDKDPSYIRAISSYVPQDTNLFNRTIRENIAYAKPGVSDDDIKHALKQADALDFVEQLPKGLDTLVGERGVKLSGGQRQRIAIARAILKNAPLLLLDEATSALDSVSEQSIQKALHNLMQNRTSVVIAHRLSTLKHLDNIIVLNNGKIVEQGKHATLLKKDGIYADLWRRQKDGFIIE